jgi:hypothetical protein
MASRSRNPALSAKAPCHDGWQIFGLAAAAAILAATATGAQFFLGGEAA